jgi:aryl-alcohol dehydrogenase-like predicted oxidoreductase
MEATMRYRNLGNTGLSVGVIAFGTEHLLHATSAEVDAVMERAVSLCEAA